jgi:cell division protein FtsQ
MADIKQVSRTSRVASSLKTQTVSSDSQKKPLKLLSRSDTYELKGDRATIRRETPIPGSASSGSGAMKIRKTARRDARYEAFQGLQEGVPARHIGDGSPEKNPLHKKKLAKSGSRASLAGAATNLAKSARKKDGKEAKRGEIIRLVAAFSALFGIVVGLYFWLPEVTKITKVSVNGMNTVSEKDIVSALKLTPTTNLLNADLKAMENRVLLIPSIASVRIARSVPDRLVVSVGEREPVARVFIPTETGMRPAFIDAQGVAFAWDDGQSSTGALPILSGIRFQNFMPGQRLPDFLLPVLKDIAEIQHSNPTLLRAFSEIKIEKISENEAELLLFPVSPAIPVRMAPHLTEANLGSVLLVLDVLSSRPDVGKIQEVDFRTGTITYGIKEAQAG